MGGVFSLVMTPGVTERQVVAFSRRFHIQARVEVRPPVSEAQALRPEREAR